MDKRSDGAIHIGGVLGGLLKRLRPETEQGMLLIWEVWDRAAGAETARNARPAAFKGSILLVHVVSSTWLHHMHYRKAELILRLNQELGRTAVSDIKFKIGAF